MHLTTQPPGAQRPRALPGDETMNEPTQHEEGHYASRAAALADAESTLSRSGLDTSQIIEAFKPWESEMGNGD